MTSKCMSTREGKHSRAANLTSFNASRGNQQPRNTSMPTSTGADLHPRTVVDSGRRIRCAELSFCTEAIMKPSYTLLHICTQTCPSVCPAGEVALCCMSGAAVCSLRLGLQDGARPVHAMTCRRTSLLQAHWAYAVLLGVSVHRTAWFCCCSPWLGASFVCLHFCWLPAMVLRTFPPAITLTSWVLSLATLIQPQS
jgi:hypothetical protein